MPAIGIAELTSPDREILPTSASAAYLDYFSNEDRLLVSAFQQQTPIAWRRTYYSSGQAYQVEWQDCGEPLPAWFDPLMQGFVDLLTLRHNWDSYGAGPIEAKLVHEALNFTNSLLGPNSTAPRVVPLSSGGVQLEWRRQGIDLEVVFERDEPPSFYYRNRVNVEESEYTLPQGKALLSSIIGNLD